MILPSLPFWVWLLIGAALGAILLPIGIAIFSWIRGFKDQKEAKKMIKEGKMLEPLDSKDYDSKKWEEIIDVKANEEKIKNMDKDIFKHTAQINNKDEGNKDLFEKPTAQMEKQ